MTTLTAHVRSFTSVALAGVLLGLLAACSGGGDGGGGDGGAATAGAGRGAGEERRISASDLEFDLDALAVSAGEAFTIQFDNNDSAPHNITIFMDDAHTEAHFRGDVINGGESIVYEVPALDAGEYYFHCDVHPDMNGNVTAS